MNDGTLVPILAYGKEQIALSTSETEQIFRILLKKSYFITNQQRLH